MRDPALPFVWLVAAAGACASCAGDAIDIQLLSSDKTVRKWDRFEATARIGLSPENPFDPDEIDVEADLVGPDGAHHTVPGFYYQAYERELAGSVEVLTATDEPVWMVRYAPNAEGSWSFSLSVRAGGEVTELPPSAIEVTAPSPDRHGLVGVCANDRRYFCFEDGTSFFAVGENLAWYDERGTYDYDDWLKKLAARGANYVRIWMPRWAFGLEAIEREASGAVASTSLGDYRSRLGQAWQLDHVMERAREAGIYVLLSLQEHGSLSLRFNSGWSENPYSSANGGPIDAPEDFFTDGEARALFKRRLRYVAARWSYSDALFAWELFNEVDLTEQRSKKILDDWHTEMAAELDRLDPSGRLVTTSVSYLAEWLGIDRALFSLDAIDFAQIHRYGDQLTGTSDFSQLLPTLVESALAFGKPVLLAEVGADSRGAAETVKNDPEGIAFHDILWSGIFSRSTGTGMAWFWDEAVDPEDWYVHLGPVASFVKDVAFDREGFAREQATASTPGGPELEVQELAGKNTVLVWVKNADHQWKTGGDPTVVQDAELELGGLGDGSWSLVWLDPYGKTRYGTTTVEASGGKASLRVPSFSMDIALKLWR